MKGIEFPEFDILQGTEKDSRFLVFATVGGVKIGIRPVIFPKKEDGQAILYMGFRLRAQGYESGALDKINEKTNLPFKKLKGLHTSLVGGMQLVALPATPFQAAKAIKEENLVQLMVDQIFIAMTTPYVKFIITESQVVEYLNLQFDLFFPDIPDTPYVVNRTVRFDFG